MDKIGIVDHVGKKSGMDFYDVSLAKELSKKINVYIFSNFQKKSSKTPDVIIKKTFGDYKKDENIIDKSTYFFSGFIRSFIKAKKNSVKIIILHSFSYEIKDILVYIIARFFGLKILLIAHDISGFAKGDNKIIKNIILKHLADKVLVHNAFSKRELLKENISENKVITIRLGGYIDLVNLVEKKEALSKLDLSDEYKYVLFFGQIKEIKGLDLLIEAFGKINNANTKLIIAGKVWNDNYEKYIELINNFDLEEKVIFLKRFIPDEEMDLLFSVSDIVVIPYREIYQSAVLLNALSYPSLVLCSDLEPNKEVIIDENNGFLFKSSNIQSLSEKLSMLLSLENNVRDRIKRKALETVKGEHSWDYSAKKILNYLEQKH